MVAELRPSHPTARDFSALHLVSARNRVVVSKRTSFLKKKKQKTFTNCGQQAVQMGQPGAVPNRQKFFGSFFQKRTAFFL
jgi:hypothetical protein